MVKIALLALNEFHLILAVTPHDKQPFLLCIQYLFVFQWQIRPGDWRMFFLFQSLPYRPVRPWAVTWATALLWRAAGGRSWYPSAPGIRTPVSPPLYRKVNRGCYGICPHTTTHHPNFGGLCTHVLNAAIEKLRAFIYSTDSRQSKSDRYSFM